MHDSSRPETNSESASEHRSSAQRPLTELRRILLEPVQSQLDALRERLDKRELDAKDVSRILPEAIAHRISQDRKLAAALEPITESAIKASIQKNRQVWVEALFPVMGPAIRKAIAVAIQGMVQSFNQILEHSLSLQSLKWRLEAVRTGKPFAEVVLIHTLVYQVQQVFLIHRDSGLLLQQAAAKSAVAQDADLVSAMLTAINDFVHDSFGAPSGEDLENLRVGEHTIVIERGSHAILAAVIRGNPPADYYGILQEALDTIHLQHPEELESFNGDTTAFDDTGLLLQNCLQVRFKEQKKRKKSIVVWLTLILIMGLIGWRLLNVIRDQRQWDRFMRSLRTQPGFVVTSVETHSGKHHISGLRDPLSEDPALLLRKSNIDPAEVTFQWEPYHSRHPRFAAKRAADLLQPPKTITLELVEDTLRLRGSALNPWLVETRRLVQAMPWISTIDDRHVVDIDKLLNPPPTVQLELRGSELDAVGFASRAWITEARHLAETLPGITRFNYEQLIDQDLQRVQKLRETIERQIILFEASAVNLAPAQEELIDQLLQQFRDLFALAQELDQDVRIRVVGHADSTGPEEKNVDLSRQRAEKFLAILTSTGLPSERLTAVGVGSSEPVREELDEQARAFNRSVTFKIRFFEAQR